VNIFDWSLKFKGFPLAEAQQKIEEIQAVSEADFEQYIHRQKEKILQHHFRSNPDYRNFIGDKLPLRWEDIPVMAKPNLQKPLSARLSKGFSPQNVYVNKTSGSSGHPFVFAKDKFCHALTWAIIKNRFGWCGIDLNHSFQARFYGIPLDFRGYYKERIKDFLSNRFRFNIFNLNERTLEEYVTVFRNKQFDYINGYTSSIVLFAKHLKQKGIILKEICPSLKVCLTTSEMLFEDDRLLLEKQFGIPIVNEYGASELDLIAFEHPQEGWLVNSETLFVEILDEQNKPLPHGREGKIVITSLYNLAHPFIRYEIGDIGILSPNSTFKKPILQKLTGRTSDFATLPNGNKVPGLTFYYVTKSVMEENGELKEFVVHQSEKSKFEITYVSKSEFNENQVNRIRQALEKYVGSDLEVIFVKTDKLHRTQAGKLKQFTSEVSNE
jgi:phenylacetate-CoA ligase